MTKKETLKIIAVINAAYPTQFLRLDNKTKDIMVNVWEEMFIDCEYELVVQAVKNHIAKDTKGFIPPIGAIRNEIYDLTYPDEMTEQEAVNMIMKALGNAYYKPVTAFDSLPKILQRVVGDPQQLKQWSKMDNNTVQSVVASNISRSYRALVQKQKEQKITGTYIEEQLESPVEVKRIGHIEYEIPDREDVSKMITHAVNIAKKANEERCHDK